MHGRPYSALIMAGGQHTRFGEASPLKEKIGGITVLNHCIDIFDTDEFCREIVICANKEITDWVSGDLLGFASPKQRLIDSLENRGLSVQAALADVKEEVVLVHDANRPNFSQQLIDSMLAVLRPGIGVVPAVSSGNPAAYISEYSSADREADPLASDSDEEGFFGETKKEAVPDTRVGRLKNHIDRDGLYLLQSPQAFNSSELAGAFDRVGDLHQYDDEASVFAAAHGEVIVVEGRAGNLPIVWRSDVSLLGKLMGIRGRGPGKKDKYGGLGW